MKIDPIPPVQPIGFDARSTPSTLTPEEVRAWLSSFLDPERVDGALAHPNGFTGTDPGGIWFAASKLPNGTYSVEQIDASYEKSAAVKVAKENHLSRTPELLIGQAICYKADESNREPLKPSRALTVTEQVLAKRGECIVRQSADPEKSIREWTKSMFVKHPSARFAGQEPPIAKYATQDEPMRIAAALEVEPTIRVVKGAKAVSKPVRPTGTLDRSVVRAERAASEAQAEEVQARIRARNAESNPGSAMPSQRSTGEFTDQPLAMSRRPYDRDAHPGVASFRVNPAELSSVEKQLIKGVEQRTCAVAGCTTTFASAKRRFCTEHAHNQGGKLGLKSEE